MSKNRTKSPVKTTELTVEQLDQVAGGQGIAVPVKLKGLTTVPVPNLSSIAQRDSPYETDDNLPG